MTFMNKFDEKLNNNKLLYVYLSCITLGISLAVAFTIFFFIVMLAEMYNGMSITDYINNNGQFLIVTDLIVIGLHATLVPLSLFTTHI